jgi:hypothetical protein
MSWIAMGLIAIAVLRVHNDATISHSCRDLGVDVRRRFHRGFVHRRAFDPGDVDRRLIEKVHTCYAVITISGVSCLLFDMSVHTRSRWLD